jgi:hypothetical protein
VRQPVQAALKRLHRLFASDQNARLARAVILTLVGVILMVALMDGAFVLTRQVHPVERVIALFGGGHDPRQQPSD